MPKTTPADLSLELGVPQKRIRDFLRGRHGRLLRGTTRWELDDDAADDVRSALSGPSTPTPAWTLEPGDTVRRRAIHRAYGGQQQGGISTPVRLPHDILIFTDPEAGAQFGYDAHEGLREDGSYSYTGEGQIGEQRFVRGNLAILNSVTGGRTLRLLRTRGVDATYVGAFTLDDPGYRLEVIHDLKGDPRTGIIFNLVPLDAQVAMLPAYGSATDVTDGQTVGYAATPKMWSPPDYSDVVLPGTVSSQAMSERTVTRVEFELQADFGAWLTAQGTPPRRLPLRAGAVIIEPDFFVEDREWIVEAKRSTARGYVRTAIGQVLDYAHTAERAGRLLIPVILLPGLPEPDLVNLIARLDIVLVVRDGDKRFRIVDAQ